MHKSLALLVPIALLAACSSAPPVTNLPASAAAPVAPPTQPAMSAQAPVGFKPSLSELDDPASPLAMRKVYFAYDNFKVDAKYEQMISAHATYLVRHPAAHIQLEGNADERGSREYNLALGHRRADAVRNTLNLHGVADGQMEAISYGKEKPRALCHDESCWQENRRTDIAYPIRK